MYNTAKLMLSGKEVVVKVRDIFRLVSEVYIDGNLVSKEVINNVSFTNFVEHDFMFDDIGFNLTVIVMYKNPFLFDLLILQNITVVYGEQEKVQKFLKIVKHKKEKYEKYKHKVCMLRNFKYGWKQGAFFALMMGILDFAFNDFSITKSIIQGLVFGLIMGLLEWRSDEKFTTMDIESIQSGILET